MSDVSKTSERLIARVRDPKVCTDDLHRELAKALDHATRCTCPSGDGSLRWPCPKHPPTPPRVPVQGEPNDDREALRDEFRSYLGDEIYVCSRDHSAWPHGTMGLDDFSLAAEDDEIVESLVQIASRATVPDAATEDLEAKLENGKAAAKLSHGFLEIEKEEHAETGAERDAAVAAIERVRAIHKLVEIEPSDTICGECSFQLPNGTYFGKVVEFPCDTLAALDGAPEPECEYVGQAYEASGFMRIQNDQLTPEKFDSWRKLMAQYPRVEILKRVKAVPAGPWLPVEGESKP